MTTRIYLIIAAIFTLLWQSKSMAQPVFWDYIYLQYKFTGNCQDWSGNDFHANCQNVTPAIGYDGEENGAFEHNGTNSSMRHAVLDLDDSITFSLWYYSKSDSQNTALMYNGNAQFNGYGLFMKEPMSPRGLDNKIVVVQGGVAENTFNGQYSVPLEQWIHIVMVKKRNRFELYIDGEFKAFAERNFNIATDSFSVGATPDQYVNGYDGFKGIIDEVKVYKQGFSATMVANLHQNDITSNKAFQSKPGIFNFFPNPAKNELNILLGANQFEKITIIDLKGQVVEEIAVSNTSTDGVLSKAIDVSHLHAGIYSLVASGKGGAIHKKLVID